MKKKGSILRKRDTKTNKRLEFKEFQKDYSNDNNKRINKYKRQKTSKDNSSKKELTPEFPEAIVNVILNKIISYVIYQTEVKEVYKHMDEKCYNYLKYLINPYLSTEYMFYEDGIENINYQKKKFFYKAPVPKKVNTWVCLQEPDPSEIDRYSSSSTKIVSFKTDVNDNNNKENIVNNDILNKKDLSDKKNNMRRRSAVIDDNLIVNESIEYDKRKPSIRVSSIKNSFNQENNSIKKKLYIRKSNDMTDDRKKKSTDKAKKEEEQKILELPCVDLPKEKYENKYIIKNNNEENNILRKERENLIIKQTELKALKEIQDKKDKLKRFQSRLQKNFDGSRQTFDPDGKIINIRPPHVENLINEFCFIKIPNIESKEFQKSIIKKRSSALNKSIPLKRKKSMLDKNKSNVSTKNVSKKYIYKGPMSNDTKEIFKYIKNVLLPKWQHRPVKKEFYEDDEEEKEKEQKKFYANKPFKEFFGPFLQQYIFKEEIERNPIDRINNNIGFYKYENSKRKIILPSGPNFNNMKPEIGVVIENKNNERRKEIKDGGFDFIKKYNKPSMYEFSRLLMETSNLNSKVLSSGLIESKVNEINEINTINRNSQLNKEELNYNGYMLEFSDNNNPLFQGALSINDKSRLFSSLSNNKYLSEKENNGDKINIIKGRNLLKSLEEKYSKNKYNSMNSLNSIQNDSIQLTNKVKAPNLYSYFHEPVKEAEKKLETNNEEYNDNEFKDFYTLEKEKEKEREKEREKEKEKKYVRNSALPAIRLRKKEIDKNQLREINNQINGRKIINRFNYKIIKNKKWGEEDEEKKKERERERYNYMLNNRNMENNNIIHHYNDSNKNIKLKNIGETIMNNNDDKYSNSKRTRRIMFRSSSADNIF